MRHLRDLQVRLLSGQLDTQGWVGEVLGSKQERGRDEVARRRRGAQEGQARAARGRWRTEGRGTVIRTWKCPLHLAAVGIPRAMSAPCQGQMAVGISSVGWQGPTSA